MSGIPMMELNAKSPFLWDLENLAVDTQKKFQFIDSEIDGIEGFEIASLYSSGGSVSDLGYASSSKSSKSTSVDSSTEREVKGTQFTTETNDGFQEDPRNKREFINSGSERTSSIIESSAASGESLIALELGERTYFEDVSAAGNAKNYYVPPNSTAKRSKSADIPRCQVEGCNLVLSSAKDYHRKHRVCETHSISPKVVINGVERRFCQQCSRFHGVSEFDQMKRSCRRRLSDHNARRRKAKPDVIQFNSMGMPPSIYDVVNQRSFAFDQVQVLQTRHDAWESGTDSKAIMPVTPGLFRAIKSRGSDERYLTRNGIQNPGTKLSHVSNHFLSFQSAPSDIFKSGLPVSMEPSSMEAAQDFRALSLLSTTSWGSCNQEPSLLNHSISMLPNHGSLAQVLPAFPVGVPPLSSEYWLAEQPISSSSAHGSNTSTFQLFKAPNEPPFYLY